MCCTFLLSRNFPTSTIFPENFHLNTRKEARILFPPVRVFATNFLNIIWLYYYTNAGSINKTAGSINKTWFHSGAHNSILKVSNRKSKIESFNSDEDLHVVIGHHMTVTHGHNIYITCPVRGISRPSIKWFKDNALISAQPRIYVEGEQLLLSNVTTSDTGTYSCVATSKFGSSNSSTLLTVIGELENLQSLF